MQAIKGKLVDIIQRDIYNAIVIVEDGRIQDIQRTEEEFDKYLLPGFVDAHVHIESSMLKPSEFAKIAVKHGTVAMIADPHEIANVCGLEGIYYMMNDAENIPVKVYFTAPSCVPATEFENTGHRLSTKEIKALMQMPKIVALGEMMNYPGVLNDDNEVYAKIKAAFDAGKPVDGHAPGLTEDELKKYIHAGISTDHECTRLEEAMEKIENGMHILIREGSAAQNFDALHPLLAKYPGSCMFCTDDCHPEHLEKGHINRLVSKAIAAGYDLFDVLRASSYNASIHYKINVGMLQPGDMADLIIVNSLDKMDVVATYIGGRPVFENGRVLFQAPISEPINNFKLTKVIEPEQLEVYSDADIFKVIQAYDGSLFTDVLEHRLPNKNGKVFADPVNGINKIVVINRYTEDPVPSIGFIKGFGVEKGAIASTVAHDSHNIVAIGMDDADLALVINKLIVSGGGMALSDGINIYHLPLPIAGLISNEQAGAVIEIFERLNGKVHQIGCGLNSAFMTMSFMALLVIPKLKISDKGLFDVSKFKLTVIEKDT
ncbi:MAG: adenine deaminase [Methanomethylovorans sp.]|uniref:adenine deaminase n=1 Tax=Methanomethylovorans sp. TaxID=2758717 RepID=UPI003C734FBD